MGDFEGIPSMLLESAGRGDVDGIINAINSGEDITVMNNNGWSSAMFAVASGSADALRVLLDHGVDPNVANSLGMTPLMLAIYEVRLFFSFSFLPLSIVLSRVTRKWLKFCFMLM